MHQAQLKEVGSSHEDAPETLQPAHASNDSTALKSQVQEVPITVCSPIILNGHITGCMCMFGDVTSDVITLQDDITSQL